MQKLQIMVVRIAHTPITNVREPFQISQCAIRILLQEAIDSHHPWSIFLPLCSFFKGHGSSTRDTQTEQIQPTDITGFLHATKIGNFGFS